MVRATSRRDRLQGVAATVVIADVCDRAALDRAVDGCDWVFHAAAELKPSHRLDAVNVVGSRNVAEASAAAGVRRLVFLSSTAACGPAESQQQPTTEKQCPRPVSRYGAAKLEAERLMQAMSDRLHTVILRLPMVYGPGDASTMIFVNALRRGILLDPTGWFSAIYVRDAAQAAVLCAERETTPGAVYLVSDGVPHTGAELAALGRQLFGHPVVRIAVPRWFVFAVATVSEWLNPGGAFVNRDKARELVQECWLCSPERARTELGFEPEYSLQRGLTEIVRWCSERGWR